MIVTRSHCCDPTLRPPMRYSAQILAYRTPRTPARPSTPGSDATCPELPPSCSIPIRFLTGLWGKPWTDRAPSWHLVARWSEDHRRTHAAYITRSGEFGAPRTLVLYPLGGNSTALPEPTRRLGTHTLVDQHAAAAEAEATAQT